MEEKEISPRKAIPTSTGSGAAYVSYQWKLPLKVDRKQRQKQENQVNQNWQEYKSILYR
jgi:hypothetical protein